MDSAGHATAIPVRLPCRGPALCRPGGCRSHVQQEGCQEAWVQRGAPEHAGPYGWCLLRLPLQEASHSCRRRRQWHHGRPNYRPSHRRGCCHGWRGHRRGCQRRCRRGCGRHDRRRLRRRCRSWWGCHARGRGSCRGMQEQVAHPGGDRGRVHECVGVAVLTLPTVGQRALPSAAAPGHCSGPDWLACHPAVLQPHATRRSARAPSRR